MAAAGAVKDALATGGVDKVFLPKGFVWLNCVSERGCTLGYNEFDFFF
jgi:hypothetical protein